MIAAVLVAAVIAVLACGCAASGPEAAVKADLEAMRSANIDPEIIDNLDSVLNDDAKDSFSEFLSKAGSFSYKITSTGEPAEDGSVVVTVRIRTYDFARKYLETWSDYLGEHGVADFVQSQFYALLMQNLSSVKDKDYYKDVQIVCTQPQEGVWQTDAASNMELKDALLGGLVSEIAGLAEVERQE